MNADELQNTAEKYYNEAITAIEDGQLEWAKRRLIEAIGYYSYAGDYGGVCCCNYHLDRICEEETDWEELGKISVEGVIETAEFLRQ